VMDVSHRGIAHDRIVLNTSILACQARWTRLINSLAIFP